MPRQPRSEEQAPQPDIPTPSTPALTSEEWQNGVIQRGSLMILGFREESMTLIRTSADGESATVTVAADQRPAVAAAALATGKGAFTVQDYDDEIVTAVLLTYYQRGVPFSELKEPLRDAIAELIARRGDLARRIEALLDPAQRRAG